MARGQGHGRGAAIRDAPLDEVMERDRMAGLERQVEALTCQLAALQPQQERRRVPNLRVVEEEDDEEGENPFAELDQEELQTAARIPISRARLNKLRIRNEAQGQHQSVSVVGNLDI
ncbi:hypothetical protein BVC80_7521g5 [Macleaya cordata]|uniref:Uncharacterized protein n=1 Tax=Macleaya cordata TaxID=56857 RepID=A0A200PZZ3_MACCD|nr:hypothetical protein BVC80_7521g5 [Macleaya cordata]